MADTCNSAWTIGLMDKALVAHGLSEAAPNLIGRLQGHLVSRLFLGASAAVCALDAACLSILAALRVGQAALSLFRNQETRGKAIEGCLQVIGAVLLGGISLVGIVSPALSFRIIHLSHQAAGVNLGGDSDSTEPEVQPA